MKGVAGKPYGQHVVRPYYAIENKLGAQDPAVSIRRRVGDQILDAIQWHTMTFRLIAYTLRYQVSSYLLKMLK